MPSPSSPQVTAFTRDVLGRYVCNGLDEARASADPALGGRPFTIVVIGGGTFGAAVAQHAFFRDASRKQHRILVLEGGPFVLPEHVQNLPMLGLNPAPPTSIADLRATGRDRQPRNEVWGLPWHSPSRFSGLAYCVGGRSLFWGGWSPQPLEAELPPARWPAEAVADLTRAGTGDFRKASEQIGVTVTNDFIYGKLHDALRKRLYDGINAGSVADAIPLADLPLHLDGVPPAQRNLFKLEAPLAVQGRPPRSGYFPLNKFSAVPLLIRAARTAHDESQGDDRRKRLMLVPQCHVTRLSTDGTRVTAVHTNQGEITVEEGAVVVIALGAIESTRLALDSFPGTPAHGQMGRNLIAHLRSNLTIRIPRAALPGNLPRELAASALFLKGRHAHADGTEGYFHLQITSAGLGTAGTDSEAELWKKIPDIDTFDRFVGMDDSHVVITLRGIGEMEPDNPASFVRLDSEVDEYGARRAFVALAPSARDQDLWNAMDRAADQAALVFANGGQYEVLSDGTWTLVAAGQPASAVLGPAKRRDGLGTTHHEAGTLLMGSDPNSSATDPDARIRGLSNAFVAGPAVFPTVGSPNPMLTGLALSRRLARHLVPGTATGPDADGFRTLFDGSSLQSWRMAGSGRAVIEGRAIQTLPGPDGELGLLWCSVPTPPNYTLKLEWRRSREDDNSGVFVRFPDPDSKGYNNPAWVAVHFGFEVQIDETGAPDGAGIHRTGAIYNEPGQQLSQRPAKPVDEWNEYEINVVGQTYTVKLNGVQVSQFTNHDPARGLPSTAASPSYIGLQVYPGKRMAFRNVRIREMQPLQPLQPLVAAPVGPPVAPMPIP